MEMPVIEYGFNGSHLGQGGDDSCRVERCARLIGWRGRWEPRDLEFVSRFHDFIWVENPFWVCMYIRWTYLSISWGFILLSVRLCPISCQQYRSFQCYAH